MIKRTSFMLWVCLLTSSVVHAEDPLPFKLGKLGSGINFHIPSSESGLKLKFEFKMHDPGRGAELAAALTNELEERKYLAGIHSHVPWLGSTPSEGTYVFEVKPSTSAMVRVSASGKPGGYGVGNWIITDCIVSATEKNKLFIAIDDASATTPQYSRAIVIVTW